MTHLPDNSSKTIFTISGILVFVLILYGNTFHGDFVFDDVPNIVDRADLHMEGLSLPAVLDACTMGKDGASYVHRPVSNLSFALNHWVGGLRPAGYHVVNLLIHLVATLFVFKAILLLLEIGKVPRPWADRLLIAGVATLLWAAHPMQIQAVTYIVQRMASLAAMFYVVGIWAWLKFRIASAGADSRRPWGFAFLALVTVALALGSKENAALFPAALLLVEACFFDAAWLRRLFVRPVVPVAIVLAAVVGIGIWLFSTSLLNGYVDRPFGLKERLLTEPRILFFYLYQFLAPVPENFSIDHDFTLSTSFVHPVTTLLSVAGILGMLAAALVYRKKYPLACFAVLFYFVHHLIESTVLPLELVFEHRNYLPSMFLFLPVALGLNRLLAIYRQRSRFIYYTIAGVAAFGFLFLGICTYVRNYDWQSPESLWQSAIVKAPDLTRPYHNLAWFYERTGDTDKALALYTVALEKKVHDKRLKKTRTLENMAGIYYQRGNFEKAQNCMAEALALVKAKGRDTGLSRRMERYYMFKLCLIYARTDPSRALDMADHLLAEPAVGPATKSRLFALRARILLAQNHSNAALAELQQALALAPDKTDLFLPLGVAFGFLEESKKGEWFFRQYMAGRPDSGAGWLYLAENRLLAGDTKSARRCMAAFIATRPLTQINKQIKDIETGNPDLPPLMAPAQSLELLGQVVRTGIDRQKGIPCIP
ncbi:tetratricopeptide repeat protein [Desulfosudis oleivorans]|uniref:Tetratricopeptide TPR_2 repeat protein n=1 Tax=Desulfosudis oleivorans (strain DSM 6200 / JCM 39069 / Hxd3) TaxID=96561 RepID=A8ZYW0_DESOH|nr:tetratricopeptide repeat protein [Desulfosudis oleivorans]ABW67215.1 Tetratricopeptide TPR_2 repeat protein [Desulfosudis oleivorans Hxd3]